jgi:hypothetical protein
MNSDYPSSRLAWWRRVLTVAPHLKLAFQARGEQFRVLACLLASSGLCLLVCTMDYNLCGGVSASLF